MNFENKNKLETNDIINDTVIKSNKIQCGVIWKRNCPKCDKELTCKSKSYWNEANRLNSLCHSCAFKGRLRSPEYRDKIRKSLLGRKLSKRA